MTGEAPEPGGGVRALQYAFAAHLRDPSSAPAPAGVEDRRLAVYRDLFFNNVAAFMAGNFPVLRRILDEAAWQRLMRDYFARHRARTPLFPQMAREFVRYLETEREDPQDPPFLYELAHYEWVEAALAIDTAEIDAVSAAAAGDLLAGVPVMSPLAWPLAYRFPVHRISPEFQPQEPPAEPTYLVVYRDRGDEVGFMAMNPVAARLLELVAAGKGESGRALLERIAAELAHPEPEVVVAGGLSTLAQFRDLDIVLGTAPET